MTAQKSKWTWEHAPTDWREDSGSLTQTVPAGTDYWRVTHYGFIRDNGPFRYQMHEGDFEASVRISGQYRELYHQAGLMIRIDERNWIKSGIEFVDGKQNLSVVVTRDCSDWSVTPLPGNPEFIWLKFQRHKEALKIEYSPDNADWSMLRLAYFPPNVPAKIGLMAAAPGNLDFSVTFDHFTVSALT